ncbi:MAG: ABC transporter substrate-binding protein [Alphaproteobacteria bacterium]|nr:ABC transporter substrate-binding protein [Alphaproteobacteria bacterium]
MTTRTITLGFIPLTDAAMLIAAREKGFAEDEGLVLDLVRETSWANIRDRVAIGHFAAAHMLAPMALAGSLGLPPLPVAIAAPMALGCGRNGMTVSAALWRELESHGPVGHADPLAALRAASAGRERPLVFAAVHPYSAHAYLLRYWLAAGGLQLGRDIQLEIIPPPFMVDALKSGRIDGFCVGEPWSTVATAQGAGQILTTSGEIWPYGPDKVLGFRQDWAESHPAEVLALIRALYRAALWCEEAGNASELARIMSANAYLGAPAELLLPGLSGAFAARAQTMQGTGFTRGHATFPWPSHAVWFLTQMARWGQVELTAQTIAQVRATYRPELFRAALRDFPGAAPEGDDRVEAGEIGFFDGIAFDPADPAAYLRALPRP